jgi:mRNA interferase MazF
VKGDIVLIPFPFTDLSSVKLRPALVLLETSNDLVTAFISSRIRERPEEGDILILQNHPEFVQTGLKCDSCIRIDKIATLEKDLIIGIIGSAGNQLKNQVSKSICNVYRL